MATNLSGILSTELSWDGEYQRLGKNFLYSKGIISGVKVSSWYATLLPISEN